MVINTQQCIYCKSCILLCNRISSEELKDYIVIHTNQELCTENCTKCINGCSYNAISLEKSNTKEYKILNFKCNICGKTVGNVDNYICVKCKRNITAEKILDNINL